VKDGEKSSANRHHGTVGNNLYQIGEVEGVVLIGKGPWSRRRKLMVLAAAFLLVMGAVVVKLWTHDTPASPISVVAKVYEGSGCEGGWVVPDPGDVVVPFPQPITKQPARGVQADGDAVTLTVRGRTGDSVVLESMWAEIVERRPAVPGVLLPTVCEGELTPRFFGVDLTKPAPSAVGKAGRRGGEVLKAPAFPLKVSNNDPEQLVVAAASPVGDVSWRLHLVWTAGDQRGETVVDDHGRPFRTTSLSAITATMCVSWDDAGWVKPSAEVPCEQRGPSAELGGSSDTKDFAGEWRQHAGQLSIAADGRASMTYQTSTGDGLPLFPELTLQIREVRGTAASAEVLTSTDPAAPTGTVFMLVQSEQGLDVTDPDGNTSAWCDSEHDSCGA
jgi:hypothetical protein